MPDAKEYKFDAGLIIPFDGEVMLGAAGRRYLDDQIRVGVRNVPVKKLYLKNVKKTIQKEEINSFFLKLKIKTLSKTMDIYLDVLEFLKKHGNCIIFVSVDNHEYPNFRKLVKFADGQKVIIKRESEMSEGTPEYRAA